MRRRSKRSWLPAFVSWRHDLAAVFAVFFYCEVTVASDSSAAINEASHALAPVVGPWITQDAFLGVRWTTLLASAIALAAVILADFLLRHVIHRKIGDKRSTAKALRRNEVRASTGSEASCTPRSRRSHRRPSRSPITLSACS
jgi:hypothetical protein